MQHFDLLAAVMAAFAAALATGQLLAVAGFPIPRAERRIGCVDGLRGYLALMVMMHHFDLWYRSTRLGAAWGDSSSRLFHNFGPGGVVLFFMTTGLVFYPRIRAGLRATDWRVTYISRVFRILPLQAAMVAVAAAIAYRMVPDGDHGTPLANLRALAEWLTSYYEAPLFGYRRASLINAGVLWSLWFEWMFYFGVLPILACARDFTVDRVPAFVLPIGLLLVGLWFGQDVTARVQPAILKFTALFALGMIAFELRERPRANAVLNRASVAIAAAVLLALAMVLADGPYAVPQVFAYALFFACVAAGNAFGGVFAWRGSVVLGEISFAIYLVHGTVLFALYTFALPGDWPAAYVNACLPVAAVVVVLLSAAAHLAIERPGIALGKRLAGPPRERLSPRIEAATADIAP